MTVKRDIPEDTLCISSVLPVRRLTVDWRARNKIINERTKNPTKKKKR